MVECTLHMHVFDVIVLNFGMKFLLRRGECKPEKFLEKWQNRNFDYKIVISVKKIQNLFSRYRMMKRISSLESSREI